MRKIYAISALSLIMGSTALSPGLAQSSPPGFLADIPGVSYLGRMGDMTLYSAPDHQNIWAVSPDETVIVEGRALSRTGQDIGAVLGGPAPQASPSIPSGETSSGVASQAPQLTPIPESDPEDLANILARGGQVTDQQQADLDEVMGGDDFNILDVNINDLDEELREVVRDEMLMALFDGLETSRSPEEFAEFMVNWSRIVDNMFSPGENTGPQTSVDTGISDTTRSFIEESGLNVDDIDDLFGNLNQMQGLAETIEQPSASGSASASLSPPSFGGITVPDEPVSDQGSAGPTSIGQAQLMAPPPAATSSASAESTLDVSQSNVAALTETDLQALGENTFWFTVGQADAPAAYVFIDPTCPFCATAMKVLKDQVESGRLSLRVIFTPVLSERSGQMVAGILAADDPANAYWRHSLSYADFGNSDIRPRNPNDLPVEFRSALLTNIETMFEIGFSGVPSFVFPTPDGVMTVEGVPEPRMFRNALPLER